MANPEWLYMFKASGLQRYIFSTNKLAEVIGGSRLIEELTGSYLDTALEAAGARSGGYASIQRAAGQATILFRDEGVARRFYATWPLLVRELAPDLEFHQWCGECVGDGNFFGDLQRGWAGLRAVRNTRQVEFPEVSPFAVRNQRTARVAVDVFPPNRARDAHDVDRGVLRKNEVAKENYRAAAGVEPVHVKADWADREWVREFPEMAGSDSFIGVIHADGNRIGAFLIDLGEAFAAAGLDQDTVVAFYQAFSKGLGKATSDAACEALQAVRVDAGVEQDFFRYVDVLNGTMSKDVTIPARPIVIGGDDFTLVVESGSAIEVTRRFLEAFEEKTKAMLDGLRASFPQIGLLKEARYQKFTACAGVVFQKHNHPLLHGYNQAEALCGFAKSKSVCGDGTTSASLMFTRLLDSTSADFSATVERDYVHPTTQLRVTAGPYGVRGDGGLVTVGTLVELSEKLGSGKIARNSVRDVIDQMHVDAYGAERAFERMEVVGGQDVKAFRQALEQVGKGVLSAGFAGMNRLSILPDAALLAKLLPKKEKR